MEQEFAKLFVGSGKEYYFRKWSEVEYSRINTWNLAAFLFSGVWFAYRKMYTYCGMFLFTFFFMLFLCLIFRFGLLGILIVFMSFPVFSGFFGNRIYQFYVQEELNRIYETGFPEEQLKKIAKKEGGTNWTAAWSVLVLWLALLYGTFIMFNLIPEPFTPINILRIIFT